MRTTLITAGMVLACFMLTVPAAQADSPTGTGTPLVASDFVQAAPRGFGDRNNSWAQAMGWWRNSLYVGTARAAVCVSDFAIWDAVAINLGVSFADTYFPYPPADPDLSCAPDGADLPIQAEIWRWTQQGNGTWQRVYQSPLAVDNPGPGAPAPPGVVWQGKKLPYETDFRGFAPFTEPDGTQAFYAFSVDSGSMWDQTKLPPPRILRTTDGVTFTPIPQTKGTFLGDLPFASDRTSFRSPVSYGGRLFVICGPVFGEGTVIASADPAKGNNAWFQATPSGLMVYELAVFNGWLYIGTYDPVNGYAVLKTLAQGTPPYQLVTVVPPGAYLPTSPSAAVVSTHVYQGRLYVGTASMTEVIRINPDDTWDLVVGPPRAVPLSGGGSEWKYPTSGLDNGFGHTLNDHAWAEDDPYGYLYVGTYNAGTAARLDTDSSGIPGSVMLHNDGGHLYRTSDGWYFTPVTTNGFANPADPHGGIFDYGFRTMASTPFGFFIGTANDYYGLAIFQAKFRGSPAPDPPARVEIEPMASGSALLSWLAAPAARQYYIFRAERDPIYIRDVVNYEGFSGSTGGKIPDVYVGPYTQIGVSTSTSFVDTTVQAGHRYMYYIESAKPPYGSNDVSDPSNLVAFPLLTPSVTFAQLLQEVNVIEQRHRVKSSTEGLANVRRMILTAQSLAASCRISAAIKQLDPQKAYSEALDPEATDLEILIAKLLRRLQLYSQYPNQVISNEFCSG